MEDTEKTKRNGRKRKDCLNDTEPSQQAAGLNVFPTISTSNFQTNAARKKERKNRTEKNMKKRNKQKREEQTKQAIQEIRKKRKGKERKGKKRKKKCKMRTT